MYRITYVHKNSSTENVLYIPGDDTYSIISGKLDLEMGKAGSLTLSLQSNNLARNEVVCLTDEIIVYRRNQEIFRGRAITSQEDFNLTGTLVIEGCLAYLFDTWYGPFDFHDKPSVLLASLLENHNSLVENRKKIQLGNITVTDKNDYIYRASEDYMRTLEVLTSRFSDTSLGGYFRIRIANGTKYLDYLQSYATTASQTVEFGSNILDIAQKIEYGELITALIPLGKKDDQTGEYVTLDDVTPGNIYIRDQNLINVYGFICDVVHWEDVEEASNLLTKGREYLNQASVAIQTMEIKAVDLALTDPNITSLNIGDSVHVVSAPHHINQWIELAGLTLDLVDPRNDVLTFGATSTSFVSKSVSSNRQMANNLSDLTVNFHKVAADYITTEYLTTNYVAARNLEAEVAKFGYATVEQLRVEHEYAQQIDANKVNTSEFDAGIGRVGQLEGDYANLKIVLLGNAGAGDIQTIHINAQNAVIDSEMVRQAVMQTVSIADLLAGTIDTSKFRIASPDGGIVIQGVTETITDKDGNVRLQLGQDAQGDFTFVLYDETGQGVLIDHTGLKDSAISDGLIKDRMVAENASIQASKLDIASLFDVINNDGSNHLLANKIWLDEGRQTLTQFYSDTFDNFNDVNDGITDAKADANAARQVANAANENAQIAIKALEGVTSLDNLTAILTNDAHVVHTNYDGTGGSYTGALTQVYVYKGDTEVTQHAQINVEDEVNVIGTWNSSTRIYTVTNLTADDGYVDFSASYGIATGYLFMPDGKRLVMPDEKILKMNTEAATVHKRFSLSKSPDGRVGESFNLTCDATFIKRTKSGALNPESVIFSATHNDGSANAPYLGRFKIEESDDGATWTQKYMSTALESDHLWNPTPTTGFVRCTLYDPDGATLDIQTVTIMADSDEIRTDLGEIGETVQKYGTRIGKVETGVSGLNVELSKTNTEIYGIGNRTLLFQTPYTVNGDMVTFEAKLYKAGKDVHSEYPARFFSWYRKTENNDRVRLGFGYTMQVDRTTMGYGGSIVGVFEMLVSGLLKLPDGNYLKFPDGKRLMLYYEPTSYEPETAASA